MKPLPYWVKWGIISLFVYVLIILFDLLMLVVPEAFYLHFEPGSLWFLIPFVVLAFYPGLWFIGNYEALWFIIPFNILFYFLVGMFVARLIRLIKTYRSKSQP